MANLFFYLGPKQSKRSADPFVFRGLYQSAVGHPELLLGDKHVGTVCTYLYLAVHVLTVRRAASLNILPVSDPAWYSPRTPQGGPQLFLRGASIIDRSSRAGLLQLPHLEAEEDDDGSAIQ